MCLLTGKARLPLHLELFAQRRDKLLALGRPLGYQGTVDATFTLARLSEADHHQRTVEAVELLAGLFPWDGTDPTQWPMAVRLLSHGQALLDHVQAMQLTSPAAKERLVKQ